MKSRKNVFKYVLKTEKKDFFFFFKLLSTVEAANRNCLGVFSAPLLLNWICSECYLQIINFKHHLHIDLRSRKLYVPSTINTQMNGKMHFGLLLPFRLTLPVWCQYFQLILNFRLQVLRTELMSTSFTYRTYVYNWTFVYLRTEFWYNTELYSGEVPARVSRLG